MSGAPLFCRWIVEAQTKAKSVILTEEGERLAGEFLHRHLHRHRR